MIISSIDELKLAYDMGELDIHAVVKAKVNGQCVSSVAGRFIISEIMPPEIPFEFIDKEMKKKNIVELVEKCFRTVGTRRTVIFLDKLKESWFFLCN